MYYYTHLLQNGETADLGTSKTKWKYPKLKAAVDGYIELIPRDYYPPGMSGTVYGNEEGRFNPDNHRNPHLLTLKDIVGNEWDTVGDLLLEQTEKQYKDWQEARNG